MENHVADQIRFYRRQEGLTQEQLAEAMGVSVAAVSKWEQGQSLPEIPMLMELADFLTSRSTRFWAINCAQTTEKASASG